MTGGTTASRASEHASAGSAVVARQSSPLRTRSPAGPERDLRRLQRASGNRAVSALLGGPSAAGGGMPLDPGIRADMEARFGYDFGPVRVHTGVAAASAAESAGAAAFTIGRDIVFGAGRYAPHATAGRRLLGHELAHVIQQRYAGPARSAPDVARSPRHDPSEDAADGAADRALAGAPVESAGPVASVQHIQANSLETKEAAQPSLSATESYVITWVAKSAADNVTLRRMIEAALRGLVLESKAQLAAGKGDAFYAKLKELVTSPKEALAFVGYYLLGLVKGIISPITGLFDLAKLGYQLSRFQAHLLATAWEHRGALANDAVRLGVSMSALQNRAAQALISLALNPRESFAGLSKVIDTHLTDVEKGAEGAGRTIARSFFSMLGKPWSTIAETIGEIVGTVAINIVLFVFTEGIGNAIEQVAAGLGRLGAMIGKIGKIGQAAGVLFVEISGLLGRVGVAVAAFERAIAEVAGVLLKPLKPVLQEFENVLGGLRTFLRRLLGVAEKEGAGAVEAGAAAAGKLKGPVAETPTLPSAAKPTPKAPPKPLPEPVPQPSLKTPPPEPPPPNASPAPEASGLDLDTGPRPVRTAQDPHELELGPASTEPLELDRAAGGAARPATDPHEIDLGPAPDTSKLKTYTGKKPVDEIPGVKKTKPTRGATSAEPGGSEARTGTHFNEKNAAELTHGLKVDYDPVAGRPRSVRYEVDSSQLSKSAPATDRSFKPDPTVEGAQSFDSAYTNSGYDRGHLGQREVFKSSPEAELAADQTTNVVPMHPELNRGAGSPWRASEQRTLDLAKQHGKVTVEVQPIYDANPPALSDGTPVPKAIRRTITGPDGTVLDDVTFLNR